MQKTGFRLQIQELEGGKADDGGKLGFLKMITGTINGEMSRVKLNVRVCLQVVQIARGMKFRFALFITRKKLM